MMPPTPQQSSHSSIEAVQWRTEMEDQDSGDYEKEVERQHLIELLLREWSSQH